MAQKWPKMTQNDPKCPKYDPTWPKKAQIWPKMAQKWPALFPHFFFDWKGGSANISAFRMYGVTWLVLWSDVVCGQVTWGQKAAYIRRNLPMVERVFKILKLIVISPHDSIKCQSWGGFEKIAFYHYKKAHFYIILILGAEPKNQVIWIIRFKVMAPNKSGLLAPVHGWVLISLTCSGP